MTSLDASDGKPAVFTSKIPLINGLRGLAILGVVFHHLFGNVFTLGAYFIDIRPVPFPPFTILSNSYQGVALFFMMSGFVLALPYMEGRRTMSSRTDILHFYRRRAIRLLPLYYISLVIGFIFLTPARNFATILKEAALYATGTFTFTEDHFFPEANFVLWSLGLEILFSMLFPGILILMRKYGTVRTTVVFCVVAMAARFIGFFLIADHVANLFTGTTVPVFNNIFCRIDDFVLGMALAALYIRRSAAVSDWWYLWGAASLLLGFAIRDWTNAGMPLIVQPVSNLFVSIGFFLLMGIMLIQPERIWKIVLENRPMQLIGMMCYSIFIWHGMAFNILHPQRDALHFIAYIIIVFAWSFITYRYIEFRHVKNVRDLLPKNA